MIPLADEGHKLTGDPEAIERHGCACPVQGCPHKYSLSFGYFTIGRNNDYWSVRDSSMHLDLEKWTLTLLNRQSDF